MQLDCIFKVVLVRQFATYAKIKSYFAFDLRFCPEKAGLLCKAKNILAGGGPARPSTVCSQSRFVISFTTKSQILEPSSPSLPPFSRPLEKLSCRCCYFVISAAYFTFIFWVPWIGLDREGRREWTHRPTQKWKVRTDGEFLLETAATRQHNICCRLVDC